ncbi:beta strand repeat-containing protein [Muricoccus radiodurans]|uniref:beta strand repeat-containing protein n=1 Tax=Muricoccus radiodurans TaxID=2231721 RepID=UPI003CF8462C
MSDQPLFPRKLAAEAGISSTDEGIPTTNAVTGSFGNGTLSLFGDSLDNAVTLSRNAAGQILLNGAPVGGATVANTSLMQVFGQAGNDVLTVNEANGALPKANLFGGSGNDVLTGGSGADLLFGQSDNDVLLGKGGNDFLFGGAGNDTLTGGDADDQMFGEAGDDLIIWNPGDDTDLAEGGDGIDTLQVNGGNGNEFFTVSTNGTRFRLDRVDPAPFSVDAGTMEKLVINANGGDDVVNASVLQATSAQLVVDGGTGNDTITGSQGNDVLLGGDGNDLITGGRGNDVALMGAGDDAFVWNPGDGNDVVEGQAGTDTLVFNGANIGETINVAANGGRVLFTRDVANIVTDLNDVEVVRFAALGGADKVNVGDLSGTDVTSVEINLASATGAGDASADQVTVNGTAGNDIVDVFGAGSAVSVVGLSARVNVTGSEGALDTLAINAGAGNDVVTASTMAAGVTRLVLDGGAGNDTLFGSQGADTFVGGDGNDVVLGGRGDDVALLGAGNDAFTWNPGDGSDVVEGGDGLDTLRFSGANVGESMDISANGERVRVFRDVANVTMDLNDTEVLEINALGGADRFHVGVLSGTDLQLVRLQLAGPAGGGDGAADEVTVDGRASDDRMVVAVRDGDIEVTGVRANVRLAGVDAALDRLVLNAGAGNDVVDATALPANAIGLTVLGGLGNDLVLGSAGNDVVIGGDGNDTALLGAGDDTFVWNPGDDNDVVEGQAGTDTMLFNGANISETIDIAANGGRVRFFRDIANVTMDLNDVEVVDFHALGGADTIRIGDLSGTDATTVRVGLEGSFGGGLGDGQADSVSVIGTAGADIVTLSSSGTAVSVLGLAASVQVTGLEAALDRITVELGAGNDVLNASGVVAGVAGLTIQGGLGNDLVIGSAGSDLVFGGDGNDTALLGAGNDTFVWNPGDDNDVVEGQAGFDTLLFNGANVSETVDIFANGGRAVMFRDVAAVTMDLNDVETIRFNALGGADTMRVGSLVGTDVTQVQLDLGFDAQADGVSVDGTAGADVVSILRSGDATIVAGLSAQVTVLGADAGLDFLRVNGGAGADQITVGTLATGGMSLVLDGGAGSDQLVGGLGADTLIGGADGDILRGGEGNDVLSGGTGGDQFNFSGLNGTDRVTDFANGVDQIRISGYGTSLDSFGDLFGDITQVGSAVQINLGANVFGAGVILLDNMTVAQIDASDFLFA